MRSPPRPYLLANLLYVNIFLAWMPERKLCKYSSKVAINFTYFKSNLIFWALKIFTLYSFLKKNCGGLRSVLPNPPWDCRLNFKWSSIIREQSPILNGALHLINIVEDSWCTFSLKFPPLFLLQEICKSLLEKQQLKITNFQEKSWISCLFVSCKSFKGTVGNWTCQFTDKESREIRSTAYKYL